MSYSSLHHGPDPVFVMIALVMTAITERQTMMLMHGSSADLATEIGS